MDKKKQMNFNLNNFLLAVTDILDVRDIEANNVSKSHSLRIAYVSLKLGKELKLEPEQHATPFRGAFACNHLDKPIYCRGKCKTCYNRVYQRLNRSGIRLRDKPAAAG